MFGGILREFREILGKYRILDVKSVGSEGLSKYEWKTWTWGTRPIAREEVQGD